ncbi:MAG: Stk1 family PASTA domain-containing Ser/Thr kinase [Candidatus Nanopelagicales bacterium]|jgi:eukaryotic-like serine/threonine-protein kinase|nr:Stk1 family PASTA domain-containing Ser/Thr kinase [Candidatus Nanopelagicales bacterium]MDP4907694.1 Stk1 family PASTA domain-containing Ser/Thr kinase [Candidatus Nanopelagicales bacterium]MDP4975687.1 Stk1 family PASTA domain-containing Ser/Thr kinase [Candidatus Nanopelagicales bacterium]MDP5095198.1 Stk1 family PASTA domain-containing Ser/Thr kinase [Candidatus Nanopelagicales bacterium]
MESPTAPVSNLPPDPLIGTLVDGRYRVVSRIARGGMATVYEAVDTRLDRTVALKMMSTALAEDPGFVTRFRREARAAAQLSHPHVVGVFDQGEADGLPYLAMEYVQGRTLRDVLRDYGALSPEQALTVLDPVLEALSAAHDAGFVHRDVKPENILISDDGRVKVTDFGLARAVTNTTTATQGMIIGTVAYLSPEHVEHGDADARSDVYGSGICLFEMVTGQVPFAAENPITVAYQHVNADVPAPSSLRRTIPPDVDALVATATRRDPNLRYPDCRAFLADVRRVRRSLPPPQPLSKDSHDTLVVPDDLALAAAAGATPVPAVTARPLTPGEAAVGTTGSAAKSGGRRRRGRGWIIAILLLLAVGGAAAAGWYLAAGPGKQVTVPGILGLDERAAATALQDVGLRLEVSGQEFSETVAAGLVLSSDPAPGASTGVDSIISVVLSQGPERYAVPDVVGEPLAIARTTLSEANLGVGIITEAWDSSIAAGSIVSTVPGVGEELMSGTLIDIVVSKGPKPVKIPGLTGVPADEASAQLEAAGLIVTTSEEFSSSIASGLVISTSPDKGARVDVGGTVALVVSKGPPPVEVPFLIDMIKEDAVALLQSLGLNVDINEPPFTPLNRVIAQDPSSGTLVPAGSTVTITII